MSSSSTPWLSKGAISADDSMLVKTHPTCVCATFGTINILTRHPTASERPSTSELLKELTKKESSLLQWREEDSQCHPQASLLGAELSAGKDLYTELQNTYLQQ